MESFSIHCVTCKSKLIVSRPDLLGQISACPKCGSMVQIPSVPPSSESSVSDPNSDVDIEQKRATPVQSSTDDNNGDTVEDFGYRTPEISQTVRNHDETDDPDSLEAVSQNPATTNEELADANLADWSDASTSQNRKKLLVAFSCLSTLIVIGVIYLFALSGGTQEESQLATHLSDNPDTIENGINNTEPDRQEGQAGNQEMPEDMDDPQIDEKFIEFQKRPFRPCFELLGAPMSDTMLKGCALGRLWVHFRCFLYQKASQKGPWEVWGLGVAHAIPGKFYGILQDSIPNGLHIAELTERILRGCPTRNHWFGNHHWVLRIHYFPLLSTGSS